jgi:Predicted hydrolase of the alpha/beta superfamily
MQTELGAGLLTETVILQSEPLQRSVTINFYCPAEFVPGSPISLLLVNDGQDLEAMGFDKMMTYLLQMGEIKPLLVAGIHAGEERLQEYGMIAGADYKGRGAKAPLYRDFILKELLPYIAHRYKECNIDEKAFAGFSLGGLSAFDLVWNHADVFSKVGVFSGSLWWRSKDRASKDYNDATDRMMHAQVRAGEYQPGLRFFFSCGVHDEKEDRNRNGVIDSIDDTIDMMRILLRKGYQEGKDMRYLQLPDGKHDVRTWAKAVPVFLKWGWGK